MKTKILKITLLFVITLFLFNCGKKCEDCQDCEDLIKEQKVETANTIKKKLDALFQPFNDIRLPVFLGEKTNATPQHLHIEGSIENPFFIAGTFTSKDGSSTECTISALKLEVIPSGATDAKVINYKFKDKPTVTPDGNGGLKIEVTVIEDKSGPSATPNSVIGTLDNPISVSNGKIIDMTVQYSGQKNNVIFEGVSYEKCCAPVICKTVIHIIHP